MTTCNTCNGEMNTGAVGDRDCGGDCLRCMADAGDPDCIEALFLDMMDRLSKTTLACVKEFKKRVQLQSVIDDMRDYMRSKFDVGEMWND